MHDGSHRNSKLPKHWRKVLEMLRKDAATHQERCAAFIEAVRHDCSLPHPLVTCYENDLFPEHMLWILSQGEISDFAREVIHDLIFASFDTIANEEKLKTSISAVFECLIQAIGRKIEGEFHGQTHLLMERYYKIKTQFQDEIIMQLCRTGRIEMQTAKFKQDIDDHIPGAEP
jgi:hypothetical protein